MYPRVEKIKTIEELKLVIEEGKKDNHNLLNPTHAVKKGDEIVGAWSLAGVPLVTAWNKTDMDRIILIMDLWGESINEHK